MSIDRFGAGQIGFGPIEEPSSDEVHGISSQSEPTEGHGISSQSEAPVFPRSGWTDQSAFSAAVLRAKLGLDRQEEPINWRQALRQALEDIFQRRPDEEPVIQPMYGAPWRPGEDESGGGMIALYGAPAPGGVLPGTEPEPPVEPPMVALYGMPAPGGILPGTEPEPTEPGMIALYGLPPSMRDQPEIDPPMVMLYGMPPMSGGGSNTAVEGKK